MRHVVSELFATSSGIKAFCCIKWYQSFLLCQVFSKTSSTPGRAFLKPTTPRCSIIKAFIQSRKSFPNAGHPYYFVIDKALLCSSRAFLKLIIHHFAIDKAFLCFIVPPFSIPDEPFHYFAFDNHINRTIATTYFQLPHRFFQLTLATTISSIISIINVSLVIKHRIHLKFPITSMTSRSQP